MHKIRSQGKMHSLTYSRSSWKKSQTIYPKQNPRTKEKPGEIFAAQERQRVWDGDLYLYFVFVHSSWLKAPPNPWNVLSAGSHKGVSCYVNEVTLQSTYGLRPVARVTNQVIRGLGLSVPPPGPWERERGWSFSSMTQDRDLISHASVMKPAEKRKREEDGGWRPSFGEHEEIRGEWRAERQHWR